jgi:hypothetical protein
MIKISRHILTDKRTLSLSPLFEQVFLLSGLYSQSLVERHNPTRSFIEAASDARTSTTMKMKRRRRDARETMAGGGCEVVGR